MANSKKIDHSHVSQRAPWSKRFEREIPMNEQVIAAIAYATGSLVIPIVAVYMLLRKSGGQRLKVAGAAASFLLAVVCQSLVVLLTGEAPLVTIPSAIAFSVVALIHVRSLGVLMFADSPPVSLGTRWRLYVLLVCLYIPPALVCGAVLGMLAAAAGYQDHSHLAGSFAPLLALGYVAHFVVKRVRTNEA
jgi:hypothetical protein